MASTLEQINQHRKLNGQEPLEALPGNSGNAGADDEAAKKKAAEEEEKKKSKQQVDDIDDAKVIEFLNKKGIAAKSIEDLLPKTEEDPAKLAEKKEAAKLSYGLDKGLFTKKQYDNFVSATKDVKNFVYADYHKAAKADDPSLTDEQIQEEFITEFGLDADPATRKYKYGQQKLNVLAEKMLKDNFSPIYNADQEYSQFEANQNKKKEFEKKLLTAAPNYKKDVDAVFNKIKKISTKFSDDESYEVEAVNETIESVKSKFLDADFMAKKISEGYSLEQLEDIAFTAVLRKDFAHIAKQIGLEMMKKKQAGTKGIPATGAAPARKEEEPELTENQKILVEQFKKHNPQPATN